MTDDTKRPGQDEIDASKAPLIDHLIELRQRLIWSLVGVGHRRSPSASSSPTRSTTCWCCPIAGRSGGSAPIEMIYTAPQEFLFTQMKLALFGAVCLSFPIIASQLYKFVAPGLYKNERKAFLPYLIATPMLFLLGATVVYFVVMPMAMHFFLSMQQTGGPVEIQLQARVSEYLSLIMTLIIGFGICFQLPVVLTLLARAGLVTRRDPRRAPLCHPRHHRGCGRAVAARPVQHARHDAADDPALRAVDLGGGARRSAPPGSRGAERRRSRHCRRRSHISRHAGLGRTSSSASSRSVDRPPCEAFIRAGMTEASRRVRHQVDQRQRRGVRRRPEEARARRRSSAELIALDEARRAHITKLQEAQARRNAASKEIGKAKAAKDEAKAPRS